MERKREVPFFYKKFVDFLIYKVLYYMSTFLGVSLPFGLRVAQRSKEGVRNRADTKGRAMDERRIP